MKDDILFVLADTQARAEHFAREQEVPRSSLRYINDEWKLRGIDGEGRTLYVCGVAYYRNDFQLCIEIAKLRRFKVVFIPS